MKPNIGVLIGLMASPASPVFPADLRCPPRLPGPHPGFDQMGPIPTAHWLLWRMRLFDGPAGEELKAAPAELAPASTVERRDGFTSTWHLAGNETLLMVCLYDGSKTYYRAHAQPTPTRCAVHDDNGLTQAWCVEP